MKTIICREHGGTFQVVPRRGKPPVRCTEDNRCGKAATTRVNRPAPVKTVRMPPVVVAEAQTLAIDTIPLAMAAKARLEPLGWSVAGRAWNEAGIPYTGMAEITASRGEELLVLRWREGKLETQEYTLWNVDTPAQNNRPELRLPFDPDEIPDVELVRMLHGMKVTWWNSMGQIEETATIVGHTLTVEHHYSSTGDETPADRIIKFVSLTSGFRAFRVGALLKVG